MTEAYTLHIYFKNAAVKLMHTQKTLDYGDCIYYQPSNRQVRNAGASCAVSRCQKPDTMSQMPGSRCQVPSSMYHSPGIRDQIARDYVPDFRDQVPAQNVERYFTLKIFYILTEIANFSYFSMEITNL